MQPETLYEPSDLEPMTLSQMAMLAGCDTPERAMLRLANTAEKRKNPDICQKMDTILNDLRRHRLIHQELLELAQIDDEAMDADDDIAFDAKMTEVHACTAEIDRKVKALAIAMIRGAA